MTMYAFDIETASQGEKALQYTDNQHYAAPSNYKDPEKIALNIEGQKKKAADTHALHWWTGKIVSYALYNIEDPSDIRATTLQDCGGDEKGLLIMLKEHLMDAHALVTKSGEDFDIPFTVGRLMAHEMRVPRALKSRDNFDIDKAFGWSKSSGQRSTLAAYAHGLGLPGKMYDMSGANVPLLYAQVTQMPGADAERIWDQIKKYNINDAVLTGQIYKRYTL